MQQTNISAVVGKTVRKAMADAGWNVIECFSDRYSNNTRRLKYVPESEYDHIVEERTKPRLSKQDVYEMVVEDIRELKLKSIRSIGWDKDRVNGRDFMKVVLDL